MTTIHEPVPTERAETVWRALADAAMCEGADPELVRVAAVLTLARASCGRARVGELAGLHVEDIDRRAGVLVMTHTRPGRGMGRPYRSRPYPLDDGALVMLGRWLRVRQDLVDALEHGRHVGNAFVTVKPATRPDGSLYPAGMPIHADGLKTSYRRAVARLNAQRAGSYGWSPVPSRFEQLRRAWA